MFRCFTGINVLFKLPSIKKAADEQNYNYFNGIG